MKRALVLALGFAACGPAAVAPGGLQDGLVSVHAPIATEAPTIEWTPPTASWVEVSTAESDHVAWRVVAGGGPRGIDAITSPLRYGEAGRPAGVFPPDNAGTQSTIGPEPLQPGGRYVVRINRCLAETGSTAVAGPRPDPCIITGEFVTSSTIPESQ